MTQNFAPYQSEEPSVERARSPPVRSPASSPKPRQQQPQRNISSVTSREDPWAAARAQQLPPPTQYQDEPEEGYHDLEGGRFRNDYIGRDALQGGGVTYTGNGNIFETSLKLPLRVEACLAYLLLPPVGGVALLLLEHKSDYVRFHAWQSSLVFSLLFLVHVIFSWQKVISFMLLGFDLLLIAYLTYGAWRHAETLDRLEVPLLGRLASSFVDDE